MDALTDYHAKYFAYELTKRCPPDSVEKLASALVDAQVDLNPHQVEAALFAFRSPLSKGALLADEVGLGKTIEAGLVISQNWAERKRRILVITPSNLRKQWHQELSEKFFLSCRILESRPYNAAIKQETSGPSSRRTKSSSARTNSRAARPGADDLKLGLEREIKDHDPTASRQVAGLLRLVQHRRDGAGESGAGQGTGSYSYPHALSARGGSAALRLRGGSGFRSDRGDVPVSHPITEVREREAYSLRL